MGGFERYQSVAVGCVGGKRESPVENNMSPVGTFGERCGRIQRKKNSKTGAAWGVCVTRRRPLGSRICG